MVKLVVMVILIGVLGLTWLPNFTGAIQMSQNTIHEWLGSDSEFYELVSKLWILSSHPLFQISISAGVLVFGARVLFV